MSVRDFLTLAPESVLILDVGEVPAAVEVEAWGSETRAGCVSAGETEAEASPDMATVINICCR